MTPWEQAHDRPLGDRLAEERPDVDATTPAVGEGDLGARDYEEELGISADVAGGSMPEEIREPAPPD
jgi:hypothetical protein